jgi:uncharacterized protein (DUF58 family)
VASHDSFSDAGAISPDSSPEGSPEPAPEPHPAPKPGREKKAGDSTPARPLSVPPTLAPEPLNGSRRQRAGASVSTSDKLRLRPDSGFFGARSWWRPPRKLRVTREGKYFIGITFGVGFAAINTGNNLLYLLLGMLLALIVVSSVMSELSLRRLTVVRRLPPRAQVGRPHLVEVEVHNHKAKIPSYAIEIEDLREGQPADKRCFFLKISPDSAQIAAYRRTPARRGRDRHVGFRIATRFPFGLFEKSRETAADGEIIIYPATDPVQLPAKPDGRWLGTDGSFGAGSGDEILGVRPMREGDDARDIYWRKSTLGRQLVLRERARETSRQITLVVDSEYPGDAPEPGWVDQFELKIREVASRSVAHIKRGDSVLVKSTGGESVAGNASVGADPVLRFLALLEASRRGSNSAPSAAISAGTPAASVGRAPHSRAGRAEPARTDAARVTALDAPNAAVRTLSATPPGRRAGA